MTVGSTLVYKNTDTMTEVIWNGAQTFNVYFDGREVDVFSGSYSQEYTLEEAIERANEYMKEEEVGGCTIDDFTYNDKEDYLVTVQGYCDEDFEDLGEAGLDNIIEGNNWTENFIEYSKL